jgi:hypothetical protein
LKEFKLSPCPVKCEAYFTGAANSTLAGFRFYLGGELHRIVIDEKY